MRSRVRIYAEIDPGSYFVPMDGTPGLEQDLGELICDAIEQCLDGFTIKKIEVKVDDF